MVKIKVLKGLFEKTLKRNIRSVKRLEFEDKEGITGKAGMTAPSLYKYEIIFENEDKREILVKFKTRDIIKNGIKVLNSKGDFKLLYFLALYHKILSFDKSYIRELKFYENVEADLKKHTVETFGCYKNSLSARYFILMEEIKEKSGFKKEKLHKVFDTILKFHLKYYNKEELCSKYGLNSYTSKDYKRSRAMFRYIFSEFNEENKKYFSRSELGKINEFIERIHIYHAELPLHRSLTHNDFSIRNMFFSEGDFLVYDWELSCYQNPEHDIIEFLIFVLHELSDDEVKSGIEYYKRELFEKLKLDISKEDYKRILEFNILEYTVNKLSVYRLADRRYKFDFTEQICMNTSRLIKIAEGI